MQECPSCGFHTIHTREVVANGKVIEVWEDCSQCGYMRRIK